MGRGLSQGNALCPEGESPLNILEKKVMQNGVFWYTLMKDMHNIFIKIETQHKQAKIIL